MRMHAVLRNGRHFLFTFTDGEEWGTGGEGGSIPNRPVLNLFETTVSHGKRPEKNRIFLQEN